MSAKRKFSLVHDARRRKAAHTMGDIPCNDTRAALDFAGAASYGYRILQAR